VKLRDYTKAWTPRNSPSRLGWVQWTHMKLRRYL